MHLTWHYRNADPVFGGIQARELLTYLDNLPLDVVLGDRALVCSIAYFLREEFSFYIPGCPITKRKPYGYYATSNIGNAR